MTTVFGVPLQALFAGGSLVGLINGSFYALLSLGLAIIFELRHRELRPRRPLHAGRAGGVVAPGALRHRVLASTDHFSPLIVGLFGALIERTMLERVRGLDPIYSLLLTFGLALVIQGVARNYFGVSGDPADMPAQLSRAAASCSSQLPGHWWCWCRCSSAR